MINGKEKNSILQFLARTKCVCVVCLLRSVCSRLWEMWSCCHAVAVCSETIRCHSQTGMSG